MSKVNNTQVLTSWRTIEDRDKTYSLMGAEQPTHVHVNDRKNKTSMILPIEKLQEFLYDLEDKTMILGITDLETTGLKAEDGHRITEIALILVELKDGEFSIRGKFDTLVNPQRSIPAEIQNLTGITPAMVSAAPIWEDLAPKISKILEKVDCLIAHNVAFDAPFLGLELVRVGQPVPQVDTFCTMQNGRFATALGRVPKLAKLCEVLDVEFNAEDAHRAIYDTQKLAEAFIAGHKRGLFVLDTGASEDNHI